MTISCGPIWKKYIETVNTTENTHPEKESEDKPQEKDLLTQISELEEKVFLSKFSLDQFKSNDGHIFFYTGFQSYKASIAFWNFVQLNAALLLSWNQAPSKVKADQATAFSQLQGQVKEKQ